MLPIILAGAAGEQLRPHLTVDGIRSMFADMRAKGIPLPKAILVSEHDRRDINQDLLAGSTVAIAKDDQRPEHDGDAVGIIEGVVIKSHPDIARGKARFLYPPQPGQR